MKKIGVLFGMENTFPGALVERINGDERGRASPPSSCRSAACGWPSRCGYDVIVDRISHDIPFYRAWLKNAALCGTTIINNPFWWSADDKFFNYALATKLGVAVPPTVLLPHKEHPPGTTERVDAQPALPARLGRDLRVRRLPRVPQAVRRRRLARRLQGQQRARSSSAPTTRPRTLCMTLQRGGELQGVLPLLRRRAGAGAHHALRPAGAVPRALRAEPAGVSDRRCSRASSRTRARSAARSATTSTRWSSRCEDGVPYAIDFMNPAPDADLHSVGQENFDWIVDAVAELAVKKAHASRRRRSTYRWDAFLKG